MQTTKKRSKYVERQITPKQREIPQVLKTTLQQRVKIQQQKLRVCMYVCRYANNTYCTTGSGVTHPPAFTSQRTTATIAHATTTTFEQSLELLALAQHIRDDTAQVTPFMGRGESAGKESMRVISQARNTNRYNAIKVTSPGGRG